MTGLGSQEQNKNYVGEGFVLLFEEFFFFFLNGCSLEKQTDKKISKMKTPLFHHKVHHPCNVKTKQKIFLSAHVFSQFI